MAGMQSSFQLLLSVLFISTVSLRVTKTMHYVVKEKTWQEAQLHCQEEYIDLISVWPNERAYLDKLIRKHRSRVWIGLNRDPSNIEEWSWTETSDDNKQYSFSGDSGGRDCAHMHHELLFSPKLSSALCSEPLPYYCSPGNELRLELTSWDSAQERCGELSSIKYSTVEDFQEDGWVGMRRAPNGTWMWNGEPSDYFEWHSDPPRNTDCGTFIADTEEWLGYPCDDHYGFVCYSDNLVLIKEEKTWEEALQHCRDLGEYDLLSSQYDHRFVRRHIEKAVTNEVWIGLRFLAGEWKWMDGDKMEQQGLPHCAPKGKHCGIRHKYSSTLEIRDCMEKRNFICYKFFSRWTPRPYPVPDLS